MKFGTKARDVGSTVALVIVLAGISLAHSGEADHTRSPHVVEIRQLKFQPAELTVTPGDTVVWINRDIVPHTVAALDDEWGSGEVRQNQSWRWVARSGGTTEYFCEYHPTMRAAINVR